MHWLPISNYDPTSTLITYARERVYDSQSEWERLMGESLKQQDFLSVQDVNIKTFPFNSRYTEARVAAKLEF